MAKGSGLSFDSDRIGLFLHNPITVINSFPERRRQQQFTDRTHQFFHHHKLKIEPDSCDTNYLSGEMESTYANSNHGSSRAQSPPTTIQFPVSLSCPSHDCESKAIVGEMDFFAERKDGGEESKATAATTASDSNVDRKELSGPVELDFNVNTGLHLLTANTSSDQSIVDDSLSPNSDDKKAKNELAVLQAELQRMKSENGRLTEMLNQVTTNYSVLQMHLITLMQQKQQQQQQQEQLQDEDNSNEEHGKLEEKHLYNHNNPHGGGMIVPRQFMDLGLVGTTATTTATASASASAVAGSTQAEAADEASLSSSKGRNNGRERSQSPGNNNNTSNLDSDIMERDESSEKGSPEWGEPNKAPRLNNGNTSSKGVDQATEATMRKARVSVRARSEAPMITDGCQWRKYGQKMAKGNPCPRAYYRCTMAVGCPVRKQVQRCAEDRTILVTTYEGNHNHPLPPAAMAMASTTSSAARMLLSGSMPSADGLMNSNYLARTLLPCSSSMATISASAPFPTVTLDLTQTPNPLQFQTSPNKFQLPFPNNSPQNLPSPNNPSTLLPQLFGQALYNRSKFSGLQMSSQESESSSQLGHQAAAASPMHQLADTVNALTADPNFTAALAAALTSILGSPHPNNVTGNVGAGTTAPSNNNGSVTTSNNNSNGNK